jgi:hypothetical protein
MAGGAHSWEIVVARMEMAMARMARAVVITGTIGRMTLAGFYSVDPRISWTSSESSKGNTLSS